MKKNSWDHVDLFVDANKRTAITDYKGTVLFCKKHIKKISMDAYLCRLQLCTLSICCCVDVRECSWNWTISDPYISHSSQIFRFPHFHFHSFMAFLITFHSFPGFTVFIFIDFMIFRFHIIGFDLYERKL